MSQSKHENGQDLLDAMEKTLPLKVGFCAAHMVLSPGSTVLDAGCANGETTAYFAMKNPNVKVIGVDYDGDYIKAAKAKFGDVENAEFIEADLRDFDIGNVKLDAALNLSVLHEFHSFTGYRSQTVVEILDSQLHHTRDYGLVINRDFNQSNNPEDMVYLALPNEGATEGNDYDALSISEFFLRYSQEAMRSGEDIEPEGHIKGFFTEEQTDRLAGKGYDIPEGWRIFVVQEQFAREFIWRMAYRSRFLDEARERYAFWNHNQHRSEPEKLGARVLFSAPYENPWLMENRYEPNIRLFNSDMKPLPLPPSNFVSVCQKIPDGESIALREHRSINTKPSYLAVQGYKNTVNGKIYDMVNRPGGDVVDILPYSFQNDRLIVLAKDRYPRPIANIKPRMISPNLDDKRWSGHMIEPLTAANVTGDKIKAICSVLYERAGLQPESLKLDQIGSLNYYPAPAELNERVNAIRIEITNPPTEEKSLSGEFSGFSNDGVFRPFEAQSLLQAAQTGMLPEARLETNVYALMRECGVIPGDWLGQQISLKTTLNISPRPLEDLLQEQMQHRIFEKTDERSGWLDIKRSEFHEVALTDGHEHAIAKKEFEFIVPSKDVSTNSVILACLIQDPDTHEVLMGVQKVSPLQSQFSSVQEREGHSGLLTLPGYRLPGSIDHIQFVPEWISEQIGTPKKDIKKLGEGYFPSLGVMPHRVFPYVITNPSEDLMNRCDFVPLRSLFEDLENIEDLHLMNAIFRATHALNLWPKYSSSLDYAA